MSFQQLQRLLGTVQSHYQTPEQQLFLKIAEIWDPVVGEAIAAQTRPIALQRSVLQVATSSPVWSQTLVFQRSSILKQLNDRLTIALSDIRFSTAQWHRSPPSIAAVHNFDVWKNHPSCLTVPTDAIGSIQHYEGTHKQLTLLNDPGTAFEQWSARIQARTRHLPLCPQCCCPSPVGELDRWGVCSLCAAQD